MNCHLRPKGFIQPRNRRQRETLHSRPENERRNQQMQTVDDARVNKMRDRSCSAFDQNFLQSKTKKPDRDRHGVETPLDQGQRDRLSALRNRPVSAPDDEPPGTVVREPSRWSFEAPARINNDTSRMPPGNAPYGQLRIVSGDRARPNHNRIDVRAQPVQMIESARAIDPARLAAGRCNPPVERLPELRDNEWFLGIGARNRGENCVVCQRVRRRRPVLLPTVCALRFRQWFHND